MILHRLVELELDNLERQFPGKALFSMDDYAALYGIVRREAPRHARRHGVPFVKEGGRYYITSIDLATYRAQKKQGMGTPTIQNAQNDEMKNRRGFTRAAQERQIG
ncbi:MAG: hypothetical protein FWC60_07280 [Firmicutes bacterium]|nr:hypothetical protein [Bacillota bacterium]